MTGMALRLPLTITTTSADGRLLPGGGQDHLFIADGVPLSIGWDGQGVAELLALRIAIAVGIAVGELVCRVALRATPFCCQVESCAAGDTTEERVDHRDIADDDGDKGFTTGPATGLLRTVGTSLWGRCQQRRLGVCIHGARGAYRQDQHAAQNTCHHDEETATEQDEKLQLLSPP